MIGINGVYPLAFVFNFLIGEFFKAVQDSWKDCVEGTGCVDDIVINVL